MLLLGSCKMSLFIRLAVSIVCRKGTLDPKTPSNRHTGCLGQAMQFLAAGNKIRTGFPRKAETIQKNSDEIYKNLGR
jgi:hypothetical protein